jgi:hypothetical protein
MLKEVTFLHSIHSIFPTITKHFHDLQNFLTKDEKFTI